MPNLQENHQNDFPEDEDFPPLPPPLSPGEGGQGEGDLLGEGNDGEVSKLVEVPKRKVVKRPQPKLDTQRLISERGLPALRTLFDDVKFKGKGHEAENLRVLMQKMENWAHRLFPKLQFEDFITRVEKLGAKKEVQTCLKRIRLDMPLTHDDFTEKEDEQPPPPDLPAFEEPDDLFSRLVHSTPAPSSSSSPPPSSAPLSSTPSSLTEEQRKRMELNRQRALERRLTRQQQTDSQIADSSSQSRSPPSDILNTVMDQNETDKEKVVGLDVDNQQTPSRELQPTTEEGNDLDMELQEAQIQDLQPSAGEQMETQAEAPLEEMTEREIQTPAEEEESVTEPPPEEKIELKSEIALEERMESEIQPLTEEEKSSDLKPSAEETMESEIEAGN